MRLFLPSGEARAQDDLSPLVESLQRRREWMATLKVRALLELMDDFSRRLLDDAEVSRLEGIAFLSSWLRRSNLEKVLELNLHGSLDCLDGFVSLGSAKIAARPAGLVAMWMAGNVPTLPMFSLVPALLSKHVCLVKLAQADPSGTQALLRVLASCQGGGIDGGALLTAVAVVHFDHHHEDLNRQMSLAADARVVWGGAAAVQAITALPHQEHCVDLVFGPKYSIGVIDRKHLENQAILDGTIAAFVRDIAAFDQRACSSPQTIFVERNPVLSLRQVGEAFARQFQKLPPKPGLDAYTTMQILATRAQWALAADRDVIASGAEANWTICLDRELRLKDAVQSRTVFLTEVESWRQVIGLLSPKIQTAGIAFADAVDAEKFAEAASLRGVVRCVRPGLMNLYESPWDGKLFIDQLVRWVTFKP